MRADENAAGVFMAIIGWFLLVIACFGMGLGAAYLVGIPLLTWVVFIILVTPSTVMFWYACFPDTFDDWLERRRKEASDRIIEDKDRRKRNAGYYERG